MNNSTVNNFTIKLREDRVYDLYCDGKWVVSRGSFDGIIKELEGVMEEKYDQNHKSA